MPMFGRTPIFSAYSRISCSSVYFSTTGMMNRPIFWASIAVSMNSASLKPLQMIGVSFVGHRHHGQQLRLAARFQAEAIRPAELQHLLDDLPLLVDLDRIDAACIGPGTRARRSPSERPSWISPSRCLRISAKRIRIGRSMPRSTSRSTSSFRSIARAGSLVGRTRRARRR